jgi:small subunit ribosomal protein S16
MLVIRFFRAGKKNQPSYKIVVTDKRKSSVKGRYVEEVGFFDPIKDKKFLRTERIKYWLSVGAKPSATVHNLLISEKIIEGKKIHKFKKSKKKPSEAKATTGKEEKKAEVPAAATAAAPVTSAIKEVKPQKEAKTAPEKKEEKAPEKASETLKKAEVPKAPEAKPVKIKFSETSEKKPETK